MSQSLGWKNGLYQKPSEARKFYGAITAFTLVGMALNLVGINSMRALVIAGIVQGFSTPPLMMLIMVMTNKRSIMGDHVNGRVANTFGWITTLTIFSASVGLVVSWLFH